MASMPLMFASVAVVVFGISVLCRLVVAQGALDVLSDKLDDVSVVWDVLSTLGNAVLVLGRSVGQQWMLLALLVPLVMYAACVGLGTLCYRMALSKR